MKQLITTTDDILLDELSSRLHGVLPIQPTPLLLPSDHISSSLKSTRLNGHLIYCFVIGGECRLCFPQIISVVLHDVPINDINELFINLNIHISVASQQQLDTLKLAGIMPMTADSCESYENDLKALQKLELYKYPTMLHRLGKRSASNAFTTSESGSCSKVANLAMTTAPPSSSTAIKSIEAEVEIGGIGIEITPTITTSSMNNNFNECNILKFSTTTTTTTTTPITTTNTYATTTIADTTTVTVVTPTVSSATLTTNSSSFLPIQIPIINDQSSSSSSSSGISLINSQLQSLLALQFITSQLPLANESYPISLEKLLDQTLKEPVLSVAKLLIMEFRREKELLLNQNGQLRRENALLRSALASSTVLVGLKGLTTTNVPISKKKKKKKTNRIFCIHSQDHSYYLID
uniref:Ski_Sno domain-containing protein n=1 Tax=Wuchereria bancrofti TaxID=6293 RepID=A0A1I8EJL6_WUCBA